MKQLLQGVNYLHSNGICHRDLKPANILVEDLNLRGEPYVKLADFGFATLFGSDRETMGRFVRMGTLEYMAPELVGELGHDEKVDVWALGCIAVELLF